MQMLLLLPVFCLPAQSNCRKMKSFNGFVGPARLVNSQTMTATSLLDVVPRLVYINAEQRNNIDGFLFLNINSIRGRRRRNGKHESGAAVNVSTKIRGRCGYLSDSRSQSKGGVV